MKTSTYNSWWREMGAISRGMMFIEGNIATPAALDSREQSGRVRAPAPRPSPQRAMRPDPISMDLKRKAIRLFQDLLFLGGRPMTAGHNNDLDEPFPQTDGTSAEPQPKFHRFGERDTCATC